MADPLSTLLSTVLIRTILVGGVLVTMKFLYDGLFLFAGTLLLSFLFFFYLVGSGEALFQ